MLGPKPASWDIGDSPAFSKEELSLAVHIVVLNEKQTIVVYSTPLIPDSSDGSLAFQLADDTGQVYTLIKDTALAEFDQLRIGAAMFGARSPGARKLILQVRSPGGDALADLDIAKVVGAMQEDNEYLATATFAVFRDGYLNQGGYRISFNAWSLYKGDRVADALSEQGTTTEDLLRQKPEEVTPSEEQPTPTPVPESQTALDLAGGKPITLESTLRIEDTRSGQVSYLYIVFLADSELKAELLQ
ncbi:MAG TPA: hypothetical protein VFL17_21660 [Anaerolineae bacterium]|nr:hypothetical protein [Anaerolineae bacterium]